MDFLQQENEGQEKRLEEQDLRIVELSEALQELTALKQELSMLSSSLANEQASKKVCPHIRERARVVKDYVWL